MKELKELLCLVGFMIALFFTVTIMVDAYEQETTGECRGCLILGDWYKGE